LQRRSHSAVKQRNTAVAENAIPTPWGLGQFSPVAVSQATTGRTTTCAGSLLATNENCLERDHVNTSVLP